MSLSVAIVTLVRAFFTCEKHHCCIAVPVGTYMPFEGFWGSCTTVISSLAGQRVSFLQLLPVIGLSVGTGVRVVFFTRWSLRAWHLSSPFKNVGGGGVCQRDAPLSALCVTVVHITEQFLNPQVESVVPSAGCATTWDSGFYPIVCLRTDNVGQTHTNFSRMET